MPRGIIGMAYINFDSNENYFDAIRGCFCPSRELREVESAPDVTLLHEGKDLVGARFRNVFGRNEVLGARGEDYVKAFMARKGVPYLYVGQATVAGGH